MVDKRVESDLQLPILGRDRIGIVPLRASQSDPFLRRNCK